MKPFHTLLPLGIFVSACLLGSGTSCSSHSHGSADSTQTSSTLELALDSVVVRDTLYDQQATRSGSAVAVDLVFRYPSGDSTLVPLFTRAFFGDEFQSTSPRETMTRFVEKIREEYLFGALEGEEGFSKDELTSMQSTFAMENKVSYTDSLVVSIEKTESNYFYGAAHGIEGISYHNIDRRRHSLISEGDLFIEGYTLPLSKILQRCILRDYKVKTIEDLLNETSIDASEMPPNNNFAITRDGLIYYFNPYEIAPYVAGIIQVRVPYEELRLILRPGSLLYAYLPAN